MRRAAPFAGILLIAVTGVLILVLQQERPFWVLPLWGLSCGLVVLLRIYRSGILLRLPKATALFLPAAIASLLVAAAGLIKYCILSMPEDLDLLNILNLGREGFATLTIAVLTWLCLYLLSQILLHLFRQNGFSLNTRILVFAVVATLAFIPGIAAYTLLPAQGLALLLFSYLLLLDLFLDFRNDSLTWTLIWAFFLAGLGTASINVCRMEKARMELGKLSGFLLETRVQELPLSVERVYLNAVSDERLLRLAKKFAGALSKDGVIKQFWGQPEKVALTQLGSLTLPSGTKKEKERFWANDKHYFILKQGTAGKAVFLQWPKAGIRQLLPLFSLQFLYLIFLSAGIAFLHRQGDIVPVHAVLPFDWGPRFRSRIQRMTLGAVLVSFSLIFLFAIPFLNRTIIQTRENRIIAQANSLRQELSADSLWKTDLHWSEKPAWVEQLARRYGLDFDVYNEKGELLVSSGSEVYSRRWKSTSIPSGVLQQLKSMQGSFVFHGQLIKNQPIQELFLPIESTSGALQYLGLPFRSARNAASEEIGGFLGAMLTISVFLLLIAAALAMLIANRFSAPLLQISERLRSMEIGGNQRLEWKEGNDEIGEIISAYNEAIEQLERSAQKLRQTEREAAWKEMAKQVAHEIKNPLTPMKLNIQYLLHTFRQDPEKAALLLPQAANALTEQIDGLAQIASEFSNFAQMPQAENRDFLLQEAIEASAEIFREQAEQGGGKFILNAFPGPLPLNADKNQIIRVFNNLLQNALQSIPAGRSPRIEIAVSTSENTAKIAFTDNGQGISEEIRQKVFSPNFTTKSSGMGLGLAISSNIIQQAGGRIYFKTEEGIGTTFFVELPLKPKT